MAHVGYVQKDQAAESIQPVYDDVEKKLGHVLNFFKVMAHNPGILQGFLALNGALPRMKLDARLRELAYIKTSQLNGCDYCLHYHRPYGKKAGLTDRQVAEVDGYESSDAYDDLQRDVLRYAEGVTRNIKPDLAVVRRLKEHLSDQELMELTMAVSMANLTNRMNEALAVELP